MKGAVLQLEGLAQKQEYEPERKDLMSKND